MPFPAMLVQDLMKLHINEKLSDAALGPLCLGVRRKGACEEQQDFQDLVMKVETFLEGVRQK